MDAIVTEDVRFHLKRNQHASPKEKRTKEKSLFAIGLQDNIRPLPFQAP